MFSRQKNERKLKKKRPDYSSNSLVFCILYVLYLQNAVTLFGYCVCIPNFGSSSFSFLSNTLTYIPSTSQMIVFWHLGHGISTLQFPVTRNNRFPQHGQVTYFILIVSFIIKVLQTVLFFRTIQRIREMKTIDDI